MGTSTNQPSPRRDPSWIAARKALGNSAFPLQRQSQEIWRAATSDPNVSLQSQISDRLFAEAAGLAASTKSGEAASASFESLLNRASVSTVFTELAKRALVRAAQSTEGSPRFA